MRKVRGAVISALVALGTLAPFSAQTAWAASTVAQGSTYGTNPGTVQQLPSGAFTVCGFGRAMRDFIQSFSTELVAHPKTTIMHSCGALLLISVALRFVLRYTPHPPPLDVLLGLSLTLMGALLLVYSR